MRRLIGAVGPPRCALELPAPWGHFFDRGASMPASPDHFFSTTQMFRNRTGLPWSCK